MISQLLTRHELQQARTLVEKSGLSFEENFDNLIGVFEGGALVAAGARDGNILKMLAIEETHQGGGLLGELVTELIRLGYAAGFDAFFIYTRPGNAPSFEALNFRRLVNHPQLALLEYGRGLERYLERHRSLVREGTNGAVVVNCNPFTLGHRFLIETAAAAVSTLYVFVVREDRSAFPFSVRMRLVSEGVADLANVVVLESSCYAISNLTFPAYFLKKSEPVAQIQMETDLILFGRHIAPFFGIRRRFIGTEPFCRTTRTYGETMKRILPPCGVETVEIERRQEDGEAVSAYRVRQALRREAYESLRTLVPETTLSFILSEEGRAIREKLMKSHGRH